MRLNIIFMTMLLAILSVSSQAQTIVNPDKNMPLEVSADQTLEWHRNDKLYIARGKAVAKQGKLTIKADMIKAEYRETQNSGFDIFRMTAKGNVLVTSQGNTASGDKLVYSVDNAIAVLTGKNLRLTSPDQTVTAKNRMEYWVQKGRMNAIGNARVVRGEDQIDADNMAAVFKENPATKKRELDSLEAEGNVKITTQTEILTGNKGQYSAQSNIASLEGDVKITRDQNILEGERAEVNLATNVSRMFGDPAQGGRVRGVFYPGSQKKP